MIIDVRKRFPMMVIFFFTESNERYNAPQVLKIYKSYHFHDHVKAIICI